LLNGEQGYIAVISKCFQAPFLQLLNAEDLVRSQGSPSAIYDGKIGAGD